MSSIQVNGTIYWRYDEAGPNVLSAKTHYLSSIPDEYRLSTSFIENTTSYISNPYNNWPYKLHIYEMNPSIAVLPLKYRQQWKKELSAKDHPMYVVVYRVTHNNNCHDGNINVQFFGADSWDKVQRQLIQTTDFLGVAILRSDLSILMDVTVSLSGKLYAPYMKDQIDDNYEMGNVTTTTIAARRELDVRKVGKKQKHRAVTPPPADKKTKYIFKNIFPMYNDFRIFNLNDQLYLTSMNYIVPLHLTFDNTESSSNGPPPEVKYRVIEIPPAFSSSKSDSTEQTRTTTKASLRVWIRNFSACPVYGLKKSAPNRRTKSNGSPAVKNQLYFVDRNSSETKVIHYPRYNPNDVKNVELDIRCGQQEITPYHDDKSNRPATPEPNFHNIHEYLFPGIEKITFMGDRVSASCSEMIDPTTGKPVLVAVVHPKTVYPGKTLPPGVVPNIYLSRFIAIEPHAPYSIVAKSGMFCLGYPEGQQEQDSSHQNPLIDVKMQQLMFVGDQYECPRIHFVTGLVDKLDEPDKVLVSYGVSDCMSRIVELEKSEIARLLWDKM